MATPFFLVIYTWCVLTGIDDICHTSIITIKQGDSDCGVNYVVIPNLNYK